MSGYLKALKSRKPITEIPEHTSRAVCEGIVAECTLRLKGPVSDAERVMLVHDRQDARDILALMDKAAGK